MNDLQFGLRRNCDSRRRLPLTYWFTGFWALQLQQSSQAQRNGECSWREAGDEEDTVMCAWLHQGILRVLRGLPGAEQARRRRLKRSRFAIREAETVHDAVWYGVWTSC